ncbi:MAG: hypothetical protein ACTSP3_07455, partial [Candidatus Heimdallarchaeaceae archaeon]
ETWSLWVDIYKGSYPDDSNHVKAIYKSGTKSDRMGEYSFVSSSINNTKIYLIISILTIKDVHWQVDWYYEYISIDTDNNISYTNFPIIAVYLLVILVLIRKKYRL